jgi:hypothetical protein
LGITASFDATQLIKLETCLPLTRINEVLPLQSTMAGSDKKLIVVLVVAVLVVVVVVAAVAAHQSGVAVVVGEATEAGRSSAALQLIRCPPL